MQFFMTDSERAIMTSWYRSIEILYLRCMVSEITRCYCKPDITSSSFLRKGALQAIFRDGLWKSNHDFLIVFYSTFLVTMHGFRVNEVLLHTGYDVMVIYPLGGVSDDFSWRILKERPWLPISGNGNVCPNSNGLEVIRHFLFAWDFHTGSEILGFLGKMTPRKWKYRETLAQMALSWVIPRLLSYCALKSVHGYRLHACQGI